MIKNEFKTLEKHIKELEALRRYPRVKQERDSLAMEVAHLKEKITVLESEVSTKNRLSSQLSKQEAEIKELAGKLVDTGKELTSLRNFKVKLPDGGELTLDEMRAQFLQAEEDEVERKVKERLRTLKKNIRRRMPNLVHKRLIQVLESPSWPPEIARVIDIAAREITDGILGARDQWPDWFKSYYLDEVNALVNQHLTAEFEKRVQAEAEKRLELMKAGEWKEYAGSKARAIASSLKDLLKELQGTWWFTCDRCGHRLSVDLSPSDVALLLGGKTIDIACTTCLDPAPFPFILSTVQHKVVSVSLEGLLELYMGSAPP
ncbi:hypothetical protein ES703_73140 [subsurface metagenome]